MAENPPTFTCALCRQTFHKGRSDDEANREALEIFGVRDASHDPGMVVVCDECFRRVIVDTERHG